MSRIDFKQICKRYAPGLPITVMFVLAQRWMVAGLTAGGSKG